jgi:hypothetical protein
MGRRGAPQPLRLSDPTAAATTTLTTAASATSNNSNGNLNSATSSQHNNHLHSPDALNSSTIATAASSSVTSPVDSRSPHASPRVSPFTSRFSTRRPQTSRAASDERSQTLHGDENTPPLPDHRPDASYNSTAGKVDTPASTTPVASSRPPPPEGGARLQKAQTEHSKKFSRAGFFHFAKSSKANNSLHGSSNSSLSGARNRSVSRGKDGSEPSARTGMLPLCPNCCT